MPSRKRPALSDRIKQLRFEHSLTQEELAEMADLPLPTLLDIEYDKSPDPRISTILKLAKAFEISVEELMFGRRR